MKLFTGFTLFVAAAAFQLRVRREEDDAPVPVPGKLIVLQG